MQLMDWPLEGPRQSIIQRQQRDLDDTGLQKVSHITEQKHIGSCFYCKLIAWYQKG